MASTQIPQRNITRQIPTILPTNLLTTSSQLTPPATPLIRTNHNIPSPRFQGGNILKDNTAVLANSPGSQKETSAIPSPRFNSSIFNLPGEQPVSPSKTISEALLTTNSQLIPHISPLVRTSPNIPSPRISPKTIPDFRTSVSIPTPIPTPTPSLSMLPSIDLDTSNDVLSKELTTINSELKIPTVIKPETLLYTNQNISSEEGLISSKLTIYSESGHVVEKYSQGNNIIPISKSATLSSIIVVDDANTVIPFSYTPVTNIETSSIKDGVIASVTKNDKVTTGSIMTWNGSTITLTTESNIVTIRNYDDVTISSTDNYTRPTLIIDPNRNRTFTVSYLLDNISWKCIGTALIDIEKHVMYLRLAGIITNNTGDNIRAVASLISGEVYQNRNNYPTYLTPRYSMAMATEAAPINNKRVGTNMLEDYVKFNIGERIIHTNEDVAELGTWNFSVIKLYTYKTQGDVVNFGYRFTTPEYIPSCSINVYSMNSGNGVDSYLGSDTIDESQKSDEVDITLGETTLLQCESTVTVSNDSIIQNEDAARQYKIPLEFYRKTIIQENDQQVVKSKYNDDRRWHLITEDIKVEITNHNTKSSLLALKHYIGDKLLVGIKCQDYKRRRNGYLEWYFELPPRTTEPRKEKFSCQVQTAVYQ